MDRITSLFDLVNKARSNKDYLEVLVATALRYGARKECVESVDKMDAYLSMMAEYDQGCRLIVSEANYQRERRFPTVRVIKHRTSTEVNRAIYNRLVFSDSENFCLDAPGSP